MIPGKEPPFKIINGVKWVYLHRGNGRNILVHQQDYTLFELITRDHAKSYRQHYLKTQILGLSGDSPSPDNKTAQD